MFFAVAPARLEVDLLFFDTTSTYLQQGTEDTAAPATDPPVDTTQAAEAEEAAGAGGDDGQQARFRRYGHYTGLPSHLPQMVMDLAVTREGVPVRVWCRPADTNDAAVLPQVEDDLRESGPLSTPRDTSRRADR